MKIYELSSAEKGELKEALFYGCDEYEWLSDDEKNAVDSAEWWEDIPDSVIESAFGMYDFVPGDFWCNLESEAE